MRFSGKKTGRLWAVAVVLTIFSLTPRPAAGEVDVIRMKEGPEVVLDRHPGSPVVCVVVSIGAGSAFESPRNRGITHFIEHMVFDGSERFSREEISGWVEDTGGFLNAFTRKESTTFFLLTGSGFAEQSLEVLSQMLLHSVFIPEEVEKEKNVILEEMRKGLDRPDHARERIVDRYLYRGSVLNEPIIGYQSTVSGISREDLIDYYSRYYRPRNMKIFIMGGFDAQKMRGWIGDYFLDGGTGGIDAVEERYLPPRKGRMKKSENGFYGGPPRWSNEITERREERVAEGCDILVRIPAEGNADLAAATILARILQEDWAPLKNAFESLGMPDFNISLEIHGAFCALRFDFPAPAEGSIDFSAIPEALRKVSGWKPDKRSLESSKFGFMSSEAFDREKYHYYVMLHGYEMSLLGGEYFTGYLKEIEQVGVEDVARIIRESFSDPKYNGCVTEKGAAGVHERMIEYRPKWKRLSNRCLVSAVQKPGSGIAAMHLLMKGRNFLEAQVQPGLCEIVNSMLEFSPEGEELQRKLEAIGARISWGDNPYIPMDDYLLNPSYSFVRLEAPMGTFDEASGLLLRHIDKAVFDDPSLAIVKRKMGMESGVRSGSPVFTLKGEFYRRLFGEHPYGEPIFPDLRSGVELNIESLEKFRRTCFSPENLIVTIVSGDPVSVSLDLASALFEGARGEGGMPTAGEGTEKWKPFRLKGYDPIFPSKAPSGEFTITGRGEGVYIMCGFAVPLADRDSIAALEVAAEILDRRMQNVIREKKGLAYSTGCNTRFLKGGVVMEAFVGTRAFNRAEALKALEEEVSRLSTEGPGAEEIVTAINRLAAARARRNLSSINMAHSVGMELFLFEDYGLSKAMSRVGVEDVDRIISAYFDYGSMLSVILEPGRTEK